MSYQYDPVSRMLIKTRTNDASERDVEGLFAKLDRDVEKDLKDYAKTLDKADTSKKCNELGRILRDLLTDYGDEYLDISNAVNRLASKKRDYAISKFVDLMGKSFDKYNKLQKQGK